MSQLGFLHLCILVIWIGGGESFHFTPARANLAKLGTWNRRNIVDVRLINCLQGSSLLHCQQKLKEALQTGSRDRKREPPNFRVPDLGNYHRLLVGKHTPISMDTSDWGEASNLSRLRLNAILMAPLPKYLDEESVYDEVVDTDPTQRGGFRRPNVRLTKRVMV